MSQYNIDFLKRADQAYLEGNPIISDKDYDKIYLDLKTANPDHPYFRTVGADVRGGKVDLPYTMGSLDQIYDEDVDNWVKKYNLYDKNIVVTDKLDGISCMLIYKMGKLSEAYSRGNGTQGADITRHVRKVPGVPQTIPDIAYLAVRAEIIMANELFDKHFAEEFANPRAMIAGCSNRSDTYEEVFAKASVIAYEVVETSGDYPASKEDSIKLLQRLGFDTVKYSVVSGKDIGVSLLKNSLKLRLSISPYELDGLVLSIDKTDDMVSVKRSNDLNPEYSVKFKAIDPNSIVQTDVVAVHWEISKHGFYKPRVEITPVQLFGTVVTFATGFNARFIYENNIGPGAKIEITKSGSVIPYILSVIDPADKAALPDDEWVWNDNEVEACVPNPESHSVVNFKRVLDFFETWEVDNLRESSLEKIFDVMGLHKKSFEECVTTIVDMIELEFVNCIGVNGAKIHQSLQRRLNSMKPEVFLGSWHYFGFGFGVRKAKSILSQIGGIDAFWSLTLPQVEALDGFNTKTASSVIKGIAKAKLFYDVWVEDGLLKFETVDKTTELNGVSVVLTGFRDSEFQEKLENMGAKVGSGVSKKTTHLICATMDSSSSKYKKAKELGVKICTLQEFKDEYNL